MLHEDLIKRLSIVRGKIQELEEEEQELRQAIYGEFLETGQSSETMHGVTVYLSKKPDKYEIDDIGKVPKYLLKYTPDWDKIKEYMEENPDCNFCTKVLGNGFDFKVKKAKGVKDNEKQYF